MRQWRLLRPGRSALSRRWDRIEAGFRLAAVVLFVAAVPIAAWAGSAAHARLLPAAQLQAAQRHQAAATTLADAPPANAVPTASATVDQEPVVSEWPLPDGAVRTGTVDVDPGTEAGTVVPIWLDQYGNVTAPPITAGDVAGMALGVGLLVWGGIAGVAGGLAVAARLVLDRFRAAGWAQEWVRFGPKPSRS